MTTAKPQFNEYGHFLGTIPEECWKDCSTPGQDAAEAVKHWQSKLGFEVPREMAIDYLAETGGWDRKPADNDQCLEDMDDIDLARKVLWLACGDIRENGEWFGLCR